MSGFSSVEAFLDILEPIQRIERQLDGVTRETFLSHIDIQDATAYRLLAIGEISKAIDPAVQQRHSHIPWRKVIGMRNLLAHEYFMRESEILWQTVTVGLKDLADVCRTEIAAAETPGRRGPPA